MAFCAELALGLGQELFDVGLVGIMAGGTLTILHWLMFNLCTRHLLLDVLVALGAQRSHFLAQHTFYLRTMRIVAARTFAVLNGLMLYLGFTKSVVAGPTQIRLRFQQHLGQRRSVCIVAARALTVFRRRMLHLEGFQKIVVAAKAHLCLTASLHANRDSRFMALVAFAFLVRRMAGELDLGKTRHVGARRRQGSHGTAVLINGDHRAISRAGLRHSVEKHAQYPVMPFRAASYQRENKHQAAQKDSAKDNLAGPGRMSR